MEACRAVVLQQQPEQGGGVALGPGEYIDEIRFENDMIKFIFFIFAWNAKLLSRKHGKTVFFSIFIFFFFKFDRTPGIFFFFFISYQVHTNLSLRIGLWRHVGPWGASSRLRT